MVFHAKASRSYKRSIRIAWNIRVRYERGQASNKVYTASPDFIDTT